MNKYGKPDANHADIIRALKRCGVLCHDTKMVGGGFPDIVAWNPRSGIMALLEVKDGDKPPSKQKLTKAEERFHLDWDGAPVFIVRDIYEALTAVGVDVVDASPPF